MIALENVKMKLMPDSSRLEGDMWPDQNNQDKVQVRKLRPARKEIMELCLRQGRILGLPALGRARSTGAGSGS
jgi:hypothetical protein